jgi:hypothetical protein
VIAGLGQRFHPTRVDEVQATEINDGREILAIEICQEHPDVLLHAIFAFAATTNEQDASTSILTFSHRRLS